MKITKKTIDRGLALAASVAAPVLTFAVDQHWITAMTATDLGAILAALVGGYHGGAVAQKRKASVEVERVG